MLRIGMAFALFTLVGLVGCDSDSSKSGSGSGSKNAPASASIVGTWEGRDPEIKGFVLVMSFQADGKATMETVLENMPKADNVTIDNGKQEGTYKLEDKTLSATFMGSEKKMTVKELTADKMVLTNDKGKDMTFTKKK
ncbi:MAG: lipocalin family protein [Zavarzinella sp.]